MSVHMMPMTIHPDLTSKEVEHDLDEHGTKQLNHPVDKNRTWVASCTCRKYTCKPQGTPEAARGEVYQHIRKAWRQIEKSRQDDHDAQTQPHKTLRSELQAIIDAPGTVTKARLVALLKAHPEPIDLLSVPEDKLTIYYGTLGVIRESCTCLASEVDGIYRSGHESHCGIEPVLHLTNVLERSGYTHTATAAS